MGQSKLGTIPDAILTTESDYRIARFFDAFVADNSADDMKATMVEINREIQAKRDRSRREAMETLGMVNWSELETSIERVLSNHRSIRSTCETLEFVRAEILKRLAVESLNAQASGEQSVEA